MEDTFFVEKTLNKKNVASLSHVKPIEAYPQYH
jgi:hypothetical protein